MVKTQKCAVINARVQECEHQLSVLFQAALQCLLSQHWIDQSTEKCTDPGFLPSLWSFRKLVKLRQTNKSHWEFIAVLFSQFYIWQVEKSKLCYKTSVRSALHYPLNRQDISGIISIKILEKTLKRKLEQQLTLNEFLLTIFLTNGPKIRSHFASNVLHKMQNTFLNEWDLKNKLLSRQPKRFFYITPWEGSQGWWWWWW